jgi:hypothetical protein
MLELLGILRDQLRQIGGKAPVPQFTFGVALVSAGDESARRLADPTPPPDQRLAVNDR